MILFTAALCIQLQQSITFSFGPVTADYEGLADGIPSSSTVSGEPKTRTFLRVQVRDQQAQSSDPDTLGRWFAERGWTLDGEQSPLESVSVGLAPMVRLNFDFGGGYRAWAQLGDDVRSWSAARPYRDLPEGVRSQIEAAYSRHLAFKREQEAKVKGRTIPPTSLR